jgi:hypothetical protein
MKAQAGLPVIVTMTSTSLESDSLFAAAKCTGESAIRNEMMTVIAGLINPPCICKHDTARIG